MNEITLNASEAASVYEACIHAIAAQEKELTLGRAKPYARAIRMEIADYRALQEKVAKAFPKLVDGV